MRTKASALFVLFTAMIFLPALSQQSNTFLRHNKLIQNKAEAGGYYLISPFKVQGSPYLNKDNVLGDFYSKSETAKNVSLRYEIYYQNLEFTSSANKETVLVKEPGDLDSFILYKNEKKGVKEHLKFIYGSLIGATDQFYYTPLFRGSKYSVYKKYKSELIIPLAKASMPEMREFETNVEYWYVNEATKEIKQLKASAAAVKKEFSAIKDLSSVLKNGSMFKKTDDAMIRAFTFLNE
jgi:hypothetical protein